MKASPAVIVSVLVLLALPVLSCAHPDNAAPPQTPAAAAAPAAPAAAPASPPTALALMLDHRTDLQLRPEQAERLKAMARKLEATNAPLEQSLAKLGAEKPASEETAPPQRSRGGMGGGMGSGMGMGGGGMRGGRGGMGGGMRGGRGGGRGAPGGAAQPAAAHQHPQNDKAASLRAEMAQNHDAAVAEAFSLLDDDQQQRASQLLDANDFDPPTVESVNAAKDGRAGQPHDGAPAP
jgi:hypothetical protein